MSLSPFSLSGLPDQALLDGLRTLAARERCVEADLLVHLGEVDSRKLYAREGFSSLWLYCLEALHFSESVTVQRIAAARSARDYPLILERVRSGEVHLSGLRLLLPHLTQANHVELLDRARHKSKRAIEEMLADRAPKPDAPTLVRPMPEPRPAMRVGLAPFSHPQTQAEEAALAVAAPVAREPRPGRPSTEPLGESRYKIQFTAGPATHAKLCEAQALLRHQIPDGDVARVFERALDALLREARRAKFAETDRPRAARRDCERSSGPVSRHIPAAIKRAVLARDGGRCTFVAHGRRCDSPDALEFHHLIPFARSKRHRVSEIALRCHTHNAYAALQDFGPDHMVRFQGRGRATTITCPGAGSAPAGQESPTSNVHEAETPGLGGPSAPTAPTSS